MLVAGDTQGIWIGTEVWNEKFLLECRASGDVNIKFPGLLIIIVRDSHLRILDDLDSL